MSKVNTHVAELGRLFIPTLYPAGDSSRDVDGNLGIKNTDPPPNSST